MKKFTTTLILLVLSVMTQPAFSENLSAQEKYEKGLQFYNSENYKAASVLFFEAAYVGHAKAQYDLGNLYHYGKGVEKDMKKSFEWTLKAADNGVTDAMFVIGSLYLQGNGVVTPNAEKAYEYTLKAAINGHTKAKTFTGFMLYNGKGVTKNQSIGIEWLKQGAKDGHEPAINLLQKIGVKS